MKKFLAAALLGTSLLAINVGSASAATNCPFSNAAQNFAPNVATSPFNSTNNGNLNNFVQQLFGKTNNSNALPAQSASSPVQQSNCPLQQSSFPFAGFNCPGK